MVNTRTGLLLVTILVLPLVGSLDPPAEPEGNAGFSSSVPEQSPVTWANPGPFLADHKNWTSKNSIAMVTQLSQTFYIGHLP